MGYIKEFCIKYEYEPDAIIFLEEAYQTLKSNDEAFKIFNSCVELYESNIEFEHEPVFEKIRALNKSTGIHGFTLELLYMISLAPHLKELYIKENLPEDIYDASVCDLKWKARECKDNYGVWGMFVGWWTIGFFKLKRFAIGRLQFNMRKFTHGMSANGLSFAEGEKYIDVHIPSSGHLNYEDCQESYKRAAEFFKNRYGLENIVFGCRSWLLSPDNERILPSTSNVLKFMRDYTILEATEDPENSNLWRIFNVMKMPEKPSMLPDDSSLRRAFIKWLEAGNTINTAFGVIVFNNER